MAFRKFLLAALGLAFGATCFWLSARSVDWSEALQLFRGAKVAELAAGVALYGVGMLIRTARWREILQFRSQVGYLVSLKALAAGYAVNSALPARLGELFRADYMARQTGLSRAGILASIVLERMLDLVAAVALLGLGVALVGHGAADIVDALMAGALVAALGVAALLAIGARAFHLRAETFFLALLSRLPWGADVARQLGPRVGDFMQLLRIVRTTRFLSAVALTMPIWSIETLAVWSICRATGLDLGLAQMMCLMGAASLSTLVPTAPGYAGSYQAAYVVVLAEFGLGATAAVVAATTVQIYLIGGFTLLGFLTLAVSWAQRARASTGN